MSAAPRRIVTGHDASGKSVVLSDAPIDGAITDELRAATGPLELFDQELG
jgi:hypothetical protein